MGLVLLCSGYLHFNSADVSIKNAKSSVNLNEPSRLITSDVYRLFKKESSDLIKLEDYFLEYFIRLLKRLRDINFEDVQKQRNLIL